MIGGSRPVRGYLCEDSGRLLLESGRVKMLIEAWGRDGIRVRATMMSSIDEDLLGALLEPLDVETEVSVEGSWAELRNGAILARVVLEPLHGWPIPWRVSFHRADTGEELLGEKLDRFRRWPGIYFKHASGDLFTLEARFDAHEDERFYGLGQHQHGLLDQKGCVVELLQRNTEVPIPFLYSSRGYGFLWNNPGVGRVELGTGETRWVADATRQLDYWVTAGSPREVMERYAEATGHPPMMPGWAAGFWQCKLRYRTQEELLEVAREYRCRGLPLSVIVADFFHWTLMGEWRFDPEKWPDPGGMVRELEEMGVRLMVSVWPTVNPLSENYEEMMSRGLLIGNERGVPAHSVFADNRPEGPMHMHYYDSTNPEARRYIWGKVKEGYYDHGIRIFWLDACEPEAYPFHPENLRFHLGNGAEVANLYPLMHQRAFHEGMTEEGEEEVVTLCRAAWAGSQRYGAALWSGDIPSTFEALRGQVAAGLNVAMSGIPWWNTDIGGFHGGEIESSAFRELLVRWFQYGVFSPIFRLHGHRLPAIHLPDKDFTGAPNEAWSYGEEVYEIIRGFLFLRERMKPYILNQMLVAHETGAPVMRPLFFDFPRDEECYSVGDQFMFGDEIMVAPVLEEGARSREVYLPKGESWRDAWTGEIHTGGKRIGVEAPLEKIPFYYRESSDLDLLSS